ncbi:MAG: hypothetical protein ACLVHV_13785 [Oscillospiraceae bacterium]
MIRSDLAGSGAHRKIALSDSGSALAWRCRLHRQMAVRISVVTPSFTALASAGMVVLAVNDGKFQTSISNSLSSQMVPLILQSGTIIIAFPWVHRRKSSKPKALDDIVQPFSSLDFLRICVYQQIATKQKLPGFHKTLFDCH